MRIRCKNKGFAAGFGLLLPLAAVALPHESGERAPGERFRIAHVGSQDFIRFRELSSSHGPQFRSYVIDQCEPDGVAPGTIRFCRANSAELANRADWDRRIEAAYARLCDPATERWSHGFFESDPATPTTGYPWGFHTYSCSTVVRFDSANLLSHLGRQARTAHESEELLSTSRFLALTLASQAAGMAITAVGEWVLTGAAAADAIAAVTAGNRAGSAARNWVFRVHRVGFRRAIEELQLLRQSPQFAGWRTAAFSRANVAAQVSPRWASPARHVVQSTAMAVVQGYAMYRIYNLENDERHPESTTDFDWRAADPGIYQMRADALHVVARAYGEVMHQESEDTALFVIPSQLTLTETLQRLRIALRAPRPPVVSGYLSIASAIPVAFVAAAELLTAPLPIANSVLDYARGHALSEEPLPGGVRAPAIDASVQGAEVGQ